MSRGTGPSSDAVDTVIERAQGRCEVGYHDIHGHQRGYDWSIQHRIPRGMGGTKRADINLPQNLLLVCGSGTTGCHGVIESHRTGATAAGWLLSRSADPAREPVLIERGRWVLLTPRGGYRDCPPPPGIEHSIDEIRAMFAAGFFGGA